MNRFILLWTGIILGVASGCEKNQNNYFPDVAFEQRVYLSNPSSQDLQAPGGWIYFQGGYKGLIIYRRYINGSSDDFIALDRGCPTHFAEDCGVIEVNTDNTTASCPCDNAQYTLFDGSPGTGASLALRSYPVVRNGDVLYISN